MKGKWAYGMKLVPLQREEFCRCSGNVRFQVACLVGIPSGADQNAIIAISALLVTVESLLSKVSKARTAPQ